MNMPSRQEPDFESALRFSCTACGRCCHGLRLLLSLSEAVGWLEHGGRVELLCDAAPDMPFAEGSGEAYRAARAVPATSQALPVTVAVLLTAVFDGPCPNLGPDMLCGAYDRRPNACRIYPAEIRPDRRIVPEEKLCPAGAWGGTQPVFVDPASGMADPVTAVAITGARTAGVEDVAGKAMLMDLLGIDQVALANEGYAVWKPASDALLSALRSVVDSAPIDPRPIHVQIISPRAQTRQMIVEAEGADAAPDPARGYDYLPLFA
ncbi:YkgJ family cysteine cluster protein [Sphingobium sp.]|uniref:YkgJ family cysteine cluster protein n=1 Tax=Sphingobium sp. TaxID=1912891 RepID=UPI003B3ACC8F